MAEVSRKVLGWRLKALPYLYSAFYDSHTFGCPIARPLWFNFPSDPCHAAPAGAVDDGWAPHPLMRSQSIVTADCAHPAHAQNFHLPPPKVGGADDEQIVMGLRLFFIAVM